MGIAADHEGFADLDSSTRANREESFGFRNGKTDRLLAENMLTGFGGSDSPRDVEMIGKRIVDSVDIRIGEKSFVRAVRRGNAQGGGRLLRLRKTARCDGGDAGVLALLHGGDDFPADAGGAENSPAKLVGHIWLSSICKLETDFARALLAFLKPASGHLAWELRHNTHRMAATRKLTHSSVSGSVGILRATEPDWFSLRELVPMTNRHLTS